jgi:hypothetical protein
MPLQLTPEAKALLSKTIRGLREQLLNDLHVRVESEYRLSIPQVAKAGLSEAARKRRERLEEWIEERVRALPKKEQDAGRERVQREAEKEAAYTLLHRLVLLRQMEALGLSKPEVVKGGWNSKGYREFRDFAPALLNDETQGYATLLQLVFDELAQDLPGLFGDVGVTRLLPVPPSTLRAVVEALNQPGLDSAWGDDTTLGWVYQYWNDPEREGLDAKITDGGKIEPHEIASKTQMFTERYMVEWLLHNSLGVTWLAMCEKHGWAPDAKQVLDVLDQRRAEWRAKRDKGEVPLDALMPIHSDIEERWKYYVPQPMPKEVVEKAPKSIREVKLLDPACGSGHFLVIAFDLLAALYEEEARHRGQTLTKREIAESILEHNLHGVDIDPRPIQIAAAALYLKARTLAVEARLKQVNLVASNLQLSSLPDNDPALLRLYKEVKQETGIPEELTRKIVSALKGADHLGTLLKVDAAVEDAIRAHERGVAAAAQAKFGFAGGGVVPTQVSLGLGAAKESILDKLEEFLSRHASEEDLGLRLDGEQLARGVRFIRLVKESSYDIVVANPPYQATSKMNEAKYLASKYPRGKADLYAAFLERALELVKLGGTSAMVTMRGWLFLAQLTTLREHLLGLYDIRVIGDVDRGAFDSVPNEILAAAMTVFRKLLPTRHKSVALQPTPLKDKSYDRERTGRKRAAVLAQVGRFEFETADLDAVGGRPVIYWWSAEFLERYKETPKLGDLAPVRMGLCTNDDGRFIRYVWEPKRRDVLATRARDARSPDRDRWVPTVKGGKGRAWIEPLTEVIQWHANALTLRTWIDWYKIESPGMYITNEDFYFVPGVSYTGIGNRFQARAHRYSSVFGRMGSSVFPDNIAETLCLMNSSQVASVLEALNPTIHFVVGDVNRLPCIQVSGADEIFNRIDAAMSEHESRREASIEFKFPGPSPWRYAQDWAQRAVDRSADAPLPPYEPELDLAPPENFVSYAVGVALGRYGANGEGVLDNAPASALPGGILFLADDGAERDSLKHAACALLHKMWTEHGASVGEGDDLRTWLRTDFFKLHKEMYENRPIYFPLTSAKKSFVAWVSIHRWQETPSGALSTLLADHLLPEKKALDGELNDLRLARTSTDKKQRADAEKRYAIVQKLAEELDDFIAKVTECAQKGPPPSDAKTKSREQDTTYVMDLDDGVMVNSAALWPLLDPQWKDPKKWWKELANVEGRKDYDWSHLAARYFPSRVDKKCQEEPSLAVAHKCFWKYHPAKAYAWELRLRDEINDDFRIDEPDAQQRRQDFIAQNPKVVEQLEHDEQLRRERKKRKEATQELDFEPEPDDDGPAEAA